MRPSVRIATRRSELALWQAEHVRERLMAASPGLQVELLPLVTQGDRILDRPLASIGGKGLFLKELEHAMLDGTADLAVHSMKDVPVEATTGLPICAVLDRANPFDAVLSRSGESLEELPPNARVGTSSLRRQCQLKALRPDLKAMDLRGNINTRIRKLDEGHYDAIILACAGLERLALNHRVNATLQAPAWLPAVSQGTIGIQCREEDDELCELLATLEDRQTALCTRVERAVSRRLQGSCQLPLAVYARLEGDDLKIDALVGEPDGSVLIRSKVSGRPDASGVLANAVADDLLGQGAAAIIERMSRPGTV